ncbi:MAG TPA: helix-turn-helix domain-containing protein [Candidatus Paceibacterota bacterium]|jgi:transcriptional regulator with XRE-family HTH domain|nr:helix-turn-helix domain-containing protein [Candidatus Paceibacterota bacterium]
MAKREAQQRAIQLRKEGKSYSEIKKELGVSKSTLSVWLRERPLSEARLKALRDWNHVRIEHYRETRRRNREKALMAVYQKEKGYINKLTARDIFIGGLFLYWGEGGKTRTMEVSLSNTNPAIVKAFIVWLQKSFGIPKEEIKIRLHLYRDMDISKEVKFWSKTLKVGRKNFKKPYIKKSALAELSYKNGFGHGTCNVLLFNAMVAKRVLMGLRVLRDFYLGP